MIRFQQVSKQFQRSTVLDGIDLDIERGDRVALVGSNGAGKTTLIRCLLGEYQCQGQVSVNGQDPRQQRTGILKHVGFVPQISPPLKMPVGQLIRFAAGVSDSDPSRMLAVSEQLGLDAHRIRHQPFNKLSGGQKQKLLISIALGRDCDLLVLDEPAANLDPEARHSFFQLLAARQAHVAMMISSHRLDEVAALVNRVVELDQGVATSVSPDGRHLAFNTEGESTQSDLWILPLDGSGEPEAFRQSEFQEFFPMFSPDGRWLAYFSDESGQFEVYVEPYPGPGRRWRVSTQSGVYAFWSGDGGEIFYHQFDGRVMSATVEQQGAGLQIGQPRALFQIANPSAGGAIFAPTPDAESFLIVPSDSQEADTLLNLVFNWPKALSEE